MTGLAAEAHSPSSFLDALKSRAACLERMDAAWSLMTELYPICRSITGDGVRQTLARIAVDVPLKVTEVPSGTSVFDWEVPREWNVREAWIADESRRRVVDLRDHTLHVMSYSIPVDATMTLEELRPHLHSIPEHPDWIPYRTSYYREDWGFCLAHRVLEGLQRGRYTVRIDATLAPGTLTYGECLVPGTSSEEVLLFTHICHPSLCNDNLTGIALALTLAVELSRVKPRFTYRFVFAPGTIGSITWLARNERTVERVRHGLVLGLAGDRGPLTYKRSRRGDAEIDRIAAYVVGSIDSRARVIDFSPYGYDERQLCSPGFDLPIGRLTRTPNNEYVEYHTSADDFALIDREALAESLFACAEILRLAESNARYLNLSPKCEPRLGKRGLFRSTGGRHPGEFEHALLWVLNQSDGSHSLLDIAEKSKLPFEVIAAAADALVNVELLRRLHPAHMGAEST
jgi:aminopeptidase-like protein